MIHREITPIPGHTATVGTFTGLETAMAVCSCGLTAVSTPRRVESLLRRKHPRPATVADISALTSTNDPSQTITDPKITRGQVR